MLGLQNPSEGRLFSSSQKPFEVFAHAFWKEGALSAPGLDDNSGKEKEVKDGKRSAFEGRRYGVEKRQRILGEHQQCLL